MRDSEQYGRNNPQNDEPGTKKDRSFVQMRILRSGADCACRERKKPTIPKPKVAMVSVVLTQASVVRSSAS